MAEESSLHIPIVDLSVFIGKGDDDQQGKKLAMAAITEAFSASGFFLVKNHGVPLHLMNKSLQVSTKFFECSDEDKSLYTIKPGVFPTVGYFPSPKGSVDQCEHFFIVLPSSALNHSPTDPPEFREVLEEMYLYLSELGSSIENIVCDCLELPCDTLKEYNNDRSWDFLLALRYLPAFGDQFSGKSYHTDGGCITLVFQEDGVEGLQVYNGGKWIAIMPPEGTILVNLGDAIQVLSNDRLMSPVHRVIRPVGRSRHSFAFFYNFHGDKWIEPLPHFTRKIGDPPKYRGFSFKEYVQLRMRNKTDPPSRLEDLITINHYAVTGS